MFNIHSTARFAPVGAHRPSVGLAHTESDPHAMIGAFATCICKERVDILERFLIQMCHVDSTKVRSAAASLLSSAGYVVRCDSRIGTLDDVPKDSLLAFILPRCVCTSEMNETDSSLSRRYL